METLEVEAGPYKATLNRPSRVSWGPDGVRAAPLDVKALGGRIVGTAELREEALRASLVGEEIDLSHLHPINQDEVRRLLGVADVDGVGSLSTKERAFLDNMTRPRRTS